MLMNEHFIAENERSKLDPLPEEKSTPSQPTATTTETYKRVYPDWKPSTTLEKTDVVGTMEAIEDAQMTRAKDKSAWRKSSLNSSDDTESSNRPSHSTTARGSAPLQSILEEDRRKSIIQQLGERPSSDRLHIYIRRPSDAPSEQHSRTNDKQPEITSVGITSDQHSIYIRPATEPRSPRSTAQPAIIELSQSPKASTSKWLDRSPSSTTADATNNKIEIDSDNIETPPTTRRNLITENKTIANPCRKLQTPRPLHRHTVDEISGEDVPSVDAKASEKTGEPEVLGDGQFDRYSVARRTRRYRRPTDYSSGNEDRTETSPELSSPTEHSVGNKSKLQTNNTMCLDKLQSSDNNDISDDSLNMDNDKTIRNSKSADVLSRVGKVGRNLSTINQEDVREAIRNLKSPTEGPDRIWSPPREIVAKEKVGPAKTSNHELNDEGFEETQSLVSDTPSQGRDSTSSYTDQPDSKTPKRTTKSLRSSSCDPKLGSASPKKRPVVPKSTVQTLLERNLESLERSRSLRSATTSPASRTVLPRRTNSLRKAASVDQASPVPASKRDVERSGSRTSLRSSRSSLNSATSVNTVRNVPLKTTRSQPITTITLDKTVYKKPLVLPTSKPLSTTTIRSTSVTAPSTTARTPASRSSSSGSSIGPTIRRSQTKSATPTSGMSSTFGTTYREGSAASSRPAFRNAVSNYSHSNSSLTSNGNLSASPLRTNNGTVSSPSARLSQLTKGIVSKTSRVSNFMRPTAASATKTLTGPKGK